MATITKLMKSYLSFEPTTEQAIALEKCEQLLANPQQDFLIIQGAAGTGKSSIIEAITAYMFNNEKHFVIGAPTTKACQVIQQKTGYRANTIFSLVFKQLNENGESWVRKTNVETKRTLFIIDESSMIGDVIDLKNSSFKTNKPALTGLIEFVKEGNSENQIIFIGDNYQLPPIGNSNNSPALSKNYLCNLKNLKGELVAINEVKRQDKDSYILGIANTLKQCIDKNTTIDKLNCKYLNNSTAALHQYMSLYCANSFNKVVVVASTNKDVNYFNGMIRNRLKLSANILSVGDQVSADSTCFGTSKKILKGQNGIVKNISNIKETVAGIEFKEVEIDFFDNANEIQNIKTLVMLDSLRNEDEITKLNKNNLLRHEAYKNNNVFRQTQNTKDDKYLSALQLSYAYATTCHKAQGSEWENVILHPYYNSYNCRWIYTAVTRASKELYSYNKN